MRLQNVSLAPHFITTSIGLQCNSYGLQVKDLQGSESNEYLGKPPKRGGK